MLVGGVADRRDVGSNRIVGVVERRGGVGRDHAGTVVGIAEEPEIVHDDLVGRCQIVHRASEGKVGIGVGEGQLRARRES